MTKRLLILLIFFKINLCFSQSDNLAYEGSDSITFQCFNCKPFENSFLRLTGSYLYHQNKELALIQIPRIIVGSSLGSERLFVTLNALDIYLDNDRHFNDAMFGFGLHVYPFKRFLSFGFDESISYALAGWNNFTWIFRPEMALDIPLYYSQKKGFSINLHGSYSYYFRYSYKLLNYIKPKKSYYTNYRGKAIEIGLSFCLFEKK